MCFSEDARKLLNQVPPDWRDVPSIVEKQKWLSRMESKIKDLQTNHAEAFDLMNELLQESHFKFEDGKWQAAMLTKGEEILECHLHNHVMVLDEFVKQSNFLITLLEEQIQTLDRQPNY